MPEQNAKPANKDHKAKPAKKAAAQDRQVAVKAQREAQHKSQQAAQDRRRTAPQRREQPAARSGRLSSQDQQQLVRQQEQRMVRYRDHVGAQQRQAVADVAELQRQRRTAQYAYQQEYGVRLRDQRARFQRQDRYDYDRDPYFYSVPNYRYTRGGRDYMTSQPGVDLLREAIDSGYGEGWRAGAADRQDRWAFDYETSYVYRDADYGYYGFYVDRDDYNAYFREGFRRGYEDGYYSRRRYGRFSNGRATILANVLGTILHIEIVQ
jgi:hypothetical protein